MPLSKTLTAIGLAFVFASTASPAFPFICPVDHVCEPWQWNHLTNAEQCRARHKYCVGINDCWARNLYTRDAARDYLNRVIIPSYDECLERVGG